MRGGPDGATCVRTDALPDLRIGVAALGSAYLGGHRLGQLARAGRAEAGGPDALTGSIGPSWPTGSPVHGTGF